MEPTVDQILLSGGSLLRTSGRSSCGSDLEKALIPGLSWHGISNELTAASAVSMLPQLAARAESQLDTGPGSCANWKRLGSATLGTMPAARQRCERHICLLLLAALLVPARASEAIDLHDDPKPHEGNASHALPVTTTPPSTKPPAAILRSVAEEIKEELKDSKYQGVAALLAFCFGTVLVFNGDFSFKGIIACCVFVVVGITAMNEVNDWGHVARSVVGLEAGFVGAFAAYRGMDGMEVTVGAFLGVLAALRLLQFLNTFGVHFITDHRREQPLEQTDYG
eukprot:s6737_g2.t1